jgi:hypothetical protein
VADTPHNQKPPAERSGSGSDGGAALTLVDALLRQILDARDYFDLDVVLRWRVGPLREMDLLAGFYPAPGYAYYPGERDAATGRLRELLGVPVALDARNPEMLRLEARGPDGRWLICESAKPAPEHEGLHGMRFDVAEPLEGDAPPPLVTLAEAQRIHPDVRRVVEVRPSVFHWCLVVEPDRPLEYVFSPEPNGPEIRVVDIAFTGRYRTASGVWIAGAVHDGTFYYSRH